MATTTISVGDASLTSSGQSLVIENIINADTIQFRIEVEGCVEITQFDRDPANDVTFWCDASRVNGVVQFQLLPSATLLSSTITADAIDYTISLDGDAIVGGVFQGGFELTLDISATWHTQSYASNWVEWSKIGNYSFVRDKTNEAGNRPMSWNGWAWQVKKLENYVVVYGDNGITLMDPVESPAATWGFKELGSVGIASPWSISGNDFVHYFITSLGELWKFDKEGPVRLGFKEFLEPLTNPVLLYDETENRLFISDGTTGYCFDAGLGGGYAEITGVSPNYYTASSTLTGVPLDIMTDTIDLGHRGIKTITFIEVGTDTTEDLYVGCDFRYRKNESWRTSDYVLLNPEGVARLNVAGVEFRIRVKQNTYDEIEIDYINVRHQRNDKRFLRGPIYEQPDQGEF